MEVVFVGFSRWLPLPGTFDLGVRSKMIRFLQQKGRTQKILLVGFLGLISITMVMYLVPGFNDAFNASSNPDVVAKVGSREVTAQEVQRMATNMVRRQFPKGAPPQLAGIFQEQASQQLITQSVFLYEAHRLGLDASDEELRHELQQGAFSEQIFPNGVFIGTDQYTSLVQNEFQLSVAQFEDLVKQDISIRKLRDVIESGATVSSADIKDAYLKSNTKVKVEYAFVSLEQVAKGITPADSELKAYYEKMSAQLANSVPEQRKARYIVIDAANLPGAKITDADLNDYYKKHQDEYRVRGSAQVRHILISTGTAGSTPDAKAIDAARAKANDVLKQLKAGAKFADLAKKYSDDPGSKDKGGELGTIVKGQTVKPFEDAVFSAKTGDLTGPVQSEFGFHIIQVEQRTDAHLRSLDEMRPLITPVVTREKMRTQADQLASTVQAQARTTTMEKAAADHGLQIVNTDFFSRNASLPGIGNSSQFADYVFGNKPNSSPTAVPTAQGWAIAQTVDVKAARTPTFDEVKPQLAQRYSQERAQALLGQKTQELADRAHALHNLKDAAKQVNATFKTTDFVTPTQQIPDLGVLGNYVDVTAMKPGEISNAVNTGRDGAVISLVEKQIPTDEDFAKTRDQVREQLLGQKRNELLEVYVSTLRDKMEKDGQIKIFQKNLDRLGKSAAE